MVREAPQDRVHRLVANGISKKWAIARRNKRPRGFENPENACYRIGSLQPLLHLPKFANWIRKHNDKKSGWPCKADDPNRELPDDELTREVLMKMASQTEKKLEKRLEDATRRYTGCVPCMVKRLVVAYWGNELIQGTSPFRPLRFSYHHPAISPLHQLAQRWFCSDPSGHVDTLGELPENTSKAVKDRMTRKAREGNMSAQQDTEEFQRKLLEGIGESCDTTTTDGVWCQKQFNSLFKVQIADLRTCVGAGGCGNHPEGAAPGADDDFCIRVNPKPTGTDTMADAIDRSLHETVEDALCSACGQRGMTLDMQRSIISAPAYLCIHISLFDSHAVQDEDGEQYVDEQGHPVQTTDKIMNPIAIPDILDITHNMQGYDDDTRPVLYNLVSATYHAGETLRSGHYVSGVTGPRLPRQRTSPPKFWCNDSIINAWAPLAQHNALTENPVERSRSRYDPVLLWYERIPPRTERTKGAVSAADRLAMKEARMVPRSLRSGRVRVV